MAIHKYKPKSSRTENVGSDESYKDNPLIIGPKQEEKD